MDRETRIHEIQHALTDMDPADWASFLKKICPDDPALHNEVLRRQHALGLDTRAKTSVPEVRIKTKTLGEGSDKSCGRPLDELIGPETEIASYRVLRRLGSGSMGSVYLGIHARIGRLVAIKILHPELSADAEVAARFLNEARAVNHTRHPNIVSIENVGQLPDGPAYLVMEYLEGQTLSSRLKWGGGRLGPVTLHFARQIASALAAAHDHGIVHCDLKPANVMIVADPEMPGGERVKVLDFGIARLVSSGGQGQATDVRIQGTPLYMSPEQSLGATTIDGKSDVYALGVLLYQLVAGRPPFTSTDLFDLIDQHRRQPAPTLFHLAPAIPRRLCELIATMLAKEPAVRPTMREVAEHLEALYTSGAMPIPVDRRMRQRRRLVYGAITLTAVSGSMTALLLLMRALGVSSNRLLTMLASVIVVGVPASIVAWLIHRRSVAETPTRSS